MTPTEANEANPKIVFKNLYGNLETKTKKIGFKPDDKVRISLASTPFQKAYEQTFTNEVATVKKVFTRPQAMYLLKDKDGKEIKRRFYGKELAKVLVSPR